MIYRTLVSMFADIYRSVYRYLSGVCHLAIGDFELLLKGVNHGFLEEPQWTRVILVCTCPPLFCTKLSMFSTSLCVRRWVTRRPGVATVEMTLRLQLRRRPLRLSDFILASLLFNAWNDSGVTKRISVHYYTSSIYHRRNISDRSTRKVHRKRWWKRTHLDSTRLIVLP